MNKFIIGNHSFGYCLSDGDLDGADFSELIGKVFKTTHYERWMEGWRCVRTKRTVSRPKYIIHSYGRPSNFLARHSWEQITVDGLMKYKFYGEYEFNGHKVYVGLHYVDSAWLAEMEDKKAYTTYYDFGPLSTYYDFAPLSIRGGIGHGVFDTRAIDAEYDNRAQLAGVPTEALMEELEKRGARLG